MSKSSELITPEEFKVAFQEEYFMQEVLKSYNFMSYSYWRIFVAPFRSSRKHDQYYPSLSQYLEYYYACKADAYTPYGDRNEKRSYINLLNLLRRQRGLRPLTAGEAQEVLDMGCYPCYT